MLNDHLTKADQSAEYFKTTNDNLRQFFGAKHIDIVQADIDKIYSRNDILSINADAKTIKGFNQGFLTGILYLAPSNISGFNVCKSASNGCKSACLFSAGRGKFYSVYRARAVKTLAFLSNPDLFLEVLRKSIIKLEVKANKAGLTPIVRLNGTSDINWSEFNLKDSFEFINIFTYFSNIQFYDYTKEPMRILRHKNTPNYHLTFSLSEVNAKAARIMLNQGVNVAVVFNGNLPDQFFGSTVINGDDSDLRFLDPKSSPGYVIGLKAKGQAKKDQSGFVQSSKCQLKSA